MTSAATMASQLITRRGWCVARLFDLSFGKPWSTYRAWLCRDLLLAGFTEQEVMDATGLSIHTVAQARRRLPGEISLEGRDYVAR
ncbi:MAG TPA: hypothetical protein DDX54_04370 [Rhodospirillaceae bacterium]|jgi:hypothetical protein|nr:hypothetical protein [Rhodospirillaceae bacterium]